MTYDDLMRIDGFIRLIVTVQSEETRHVCNAKSCESFSTSGA